MTFRKLYLVDVDGAVGFQTVNQMADNAADLRTQMFVQHGSVERIERRGGGDTPSFDLLGHHNIVDIPRSVAQSTLSLLSAGQTVTIGSHLLWSGPSCPSLLKVDVGQYLLPVLGLGKFWAVGGVTGAGSTLVALPPQIRFFSSSSGGLTSVGLWVSTYQLSAGDFVPADLPFSFALHGTP